MDLFPHQKEAVDFLIKTKGGALFMDIGTGKTRTGIAYFQYLRKTNPRFKMLVICPLSLIESAWIKEIEELTNFKAKNMRTKQDLQEHDIYVCNYEMLLDKSRRQRIKNFGEYYPTLCWLDESSRIKNFKSKTAKYLHLLAPVFQIRVVASATPAPNVELEYWPQFHFFKPGILPNNFFLFRHAYFHLERGNEVRHSQTGSLRELYRSGWGHGITPSKRRELVDTISPYIFSRKIEECVKLPETYDEYRTVRMGKDQDHYYRKMKKDAIFELEQEAITAPVALTKLMKLREICSGFAFAESGAVVNFKHNKMTELQSVLDEIGEKQVIIWINFREESKQIREILTDNRCATLDGATKDKTLVIEGFKAGAFQYLIAHPKSAGHGLTFNNCHHQIFYSLSFSYEEYIQARGRTHRIGQEHSSIYIHLITHDTIEETVLKVLQRKGKMADIIREFLRR